MTTKNKPTHIVYAVRNYKNADETEGSQWTEIGIAYAHKDGNGLSLKLNLIPNSPDLSIQIRPNLPKQADNEANAPV
jgi:hypothetical protein